MSEENIETQDHLPEVVYHYCSVETLLVILKSHSIRMTNINQLNDNLEKKWIVKQFIDYISTPNQILQNFFNKNSSLLCELPFFISNWESLWFANGYPEYVVCFSESSDSLSQWRAYGDNGKGVAIGFDTSCLLSLSCNEHFEFYPIQYLSKEKIYQNFDENITNLFNEDNISWDIIFSTCFNLKAFAIIKNDCYYDEKEHRLIFASDNTLEEDFKKSAIDFGKFTMSKRDYFCGSEIIKSCHYLNFEKFKNDFIKRIVLGPKCSLIPHRDLLGFYSDNGYEYIDCVSSECSYR